MRLIDADDFGNRMYHEAFEKDSDLQKWDGGCWIRYKLFENVLREQPTVEPGQKKGRWVAVGERYVKCSECGLETTKNELREIALFGENEPYFCPNCGADMREENHEQT